MASEFLVSLKVGATAASSVAGVMSSTKRAMAGLTTATRGLELQQQRLGRTMSRSLATGDTGLARQRSRYDQLGNAINRVKNAQSSLANATARSGALIQESQKRWTGLATTALAAWGTIMAVTATAGKGVEFQDQLRDIRIAGALSADDEKALGQSIRDAVGYTNQDRESLTSGANELIGGGASIEQVTSQLSLMGDTMTAVRTSGEETTGAMRTLRELGADSRDSMKAGLDKLISIGQDGEFNSQEMIKNFADLGGVIKQTGLTGDKAIAELGASLQIAGNVMGGDAAKAGMQSWLNLMSDPKTARLYESAGIDYTSSMAQMQAKGLDQYEASLKIAGKFIEEKLSEKDKKSLLAGDNDGRLGDLFAQLGLGEVFKDMNAARFALAINQNDSDYQSLLANSGAGSLDALKELRMESPQEQLKALKNSLDDLGLSISEVMVPPLLEITKVLTPIVKQIGEFARANPVLTKSIAGLVIGLAGLRVAIGATSFLIWSVRVPLAQLRVGFNLVRAASATARAQWLLHTPALKAFGGTAGSIVPKLKLVGQSLLWLGRSLLMNPIGLAVAAIAGAALLIRKYWEPITAFFAGVWDGIKAGIGPIKSALQPAIDGLRTTFSSLMGAISPLIPVLKTLFAPVIVPVRLAIDGVKTLFRWVSDIFTPVEDTGGAARAMGESFGLGIAKVLEWVSKLLGEFLALPGRLLGIGVDAVSSLVTGLKSGWSGVQGFFNNLWDEIKSAFDGGIGAIGALLLNWSPVGLLYKTITTGLSALGAELPSKFSEFGSMLMSGLVNGIKNMAGAVKDSIVGMGNSVVGWFREKLQINSPSRVFMEIGGGVSEGAAVGIDKSKNLVKDAMMGLAAATAITLPAPNVAAAPFDIKPPPARVTQGSDNAAGNMTIHFSPKIEIKGSGDIKDQVQSALRFSFTEFEKLMREYKQRTSRRSYKDI